MSSLCQHGKLTHSSALTFTSILLWLRAWLTTASTSNCRRSLDAQGTDKADTDKQGFIHSPVLLDVLSMGIFVCHPQHCLIGQHPKLIVTQKDDVCPVVVSASWLVHLQHVSPELLTARLANLFL